MKARCHFIFAEAARDLKTVTEAFRQANLGLVAVRLVLDHDPNNPNAWHISARLNQTLALLSTDQREYDDAARYYDRAVEFFEKALAGDPQNYLVAGDLSALYRNKAEVHENQRRNDFAIKALEKRAALARAWLATPRGEAWKDRLLDTLDQQQGLYDAAQRHRDVLAAMEEAISLRETELKAKPGAACRSCLVPSLYFGGSAARAAGEGSKAFDYLTRTEDTAERFIAEGSKDEIDEYRYRSLILYASNQLSWIETDSVALDRRVEIFDKLQARAAQLVEKEPRVFDFRTDYGRILHRLATVYEQAGDVLKARDSHERASRLGWHDSTLILRRWYLEGFKNIAVNTAKARELETLALQQTAPPTRTIQAKSRFSGERASFTISLFEPADGKDPLADEIYRLERFFGAIIAEQDLAEVRAIYATANDKKTTVAAVAGTVAHEQARSLQDRLQTPLQKDLEEIEKLIADKKLEAAAARLAALAEQFRAGPTRRSEDALSWGALAEAFHRLALAAQAADEAALTDKARDGQMAAIRVATGLEADEFSSLRLSLAQDLERLAGRAGNGGRVGFAISLYERAIYWREKVRYDDPKNAECACSIGSDYDQIAKLSKRLDRPADALSAYHRALITFEDLAGREPKDTHWKRRIAALASDLSAAYAEELAHSFAFFYASRSVEIRKEFADRQSASTQERIDYALALETLADRVVNLNTDSEGPRKKFVEQALSSRLEANRVRISVLEVDPENGTCRCTVAQNLALIGNYYKFLGQRDKWVALMTEEIELRRRLVREQPESDNWQKFLADVLGQLADVLLDENNAARAKALREEAVDVLQRLRALYDGLLSDAGHDQKQLAQLRLNAFISLSDNAVLVGRDHIALAAAEEALEIEPTNFSATMNWAHALMYVGRVREAREIYLGNKGKKTNASRTWDEGVLEDFKKLIAMGRPHPLIDEVIRDFQRARQAAR